MVFNFEEIKRKAQALKTQHTVLSEALSRQELEIWNWIDALEDGTFDFVKELEEHELFTECQTEILVARLRYERDYCEHWMRHWQKKYLEFKIKHTEVCRDIFHPPRQE